jgi:hypothetical protein
MSLYTVYINLAMSCIGVERGQSEMGHHARIQKPDCTSASFWSYTGQGKEFKAFGMHVTYIVLIFERLQKDFDRLFN